jgi:hypothetical protein
MRELVIDVVGPYVDRIVIDRIDAVVRGIAGVWVACRSPVIPWRAVQVVVLCRVRQRRSKARRKESCGCENNDRENPQCSIDLHLDALAPVWLEAFLR